MGRYETKREVHGRMNVTLASGYCANSDGSREEEAEGGAVDNDKREIRVEVNYAAYSCAHLVTLINAYVTLY